METEIECTDGRFGFSDIHNYLRCGTYPHSFNKPDKQALRKRSKFFLQKGDRLFYCGGQSKRESTLELLAVYK